MTLFLTCFTEQYHLQSLVTQNPMNADHLLMMLSDGLQSLQGVNNSSCWQPGCIVFSLQRGFYNTLQPGTLFCCLSARCSSGPNSGQ